jgi:hypothetical protein
MTIDVFMGNILVVVIGGVVGLSTRFSLPPQRYAADDVTPGVPLKNYDHDHSLKRREFPTVEVHVGVSAARRATTPPSLRILLSLRRIGTSR